MSAPPALRPTGVLLLAAVVGTVGGVALSFHRQARAERELEALADLAEKIGQAPDPEPVALGGRNRQLGPVRLPATWGLPPYPNAFVRPLLGSGGGADGGPGPLDIAWFSTPDPVSDVLAFYQRAFAEAGRLSVTHQYSQNAGYSGWLDLGDNRLHLVAVLRDRHQTMVFPSSSDPEALARPGATDLPEGLPQIEGAERALEFDLGAQVGPLRKVWLKRYPQRSVASLVDAYREGLSARGWQIEAAESQGPSTGRVQARRGDGARVNVTLQRDASANVAVYVSVSGA